MAKPNLTKGGVISKLDLKEIDPATRRDAEVEEHADAILTDAIATAKKQGGGDTFKAGTQAEFDSGKINVDVTYGEQRKTDRELGNGAWVGQPALVVSPGSPGGFQWRFGAPRKVEMIQEGRFCPSCLQPQASTIEPRCRWAHGNSTVVTGCGYDALVDDVRPWDMP